METKLTFKSDGAQSLVSNIDRITLAIERLGTAVERAVQQLSKISVPGMPGGPPPGGPPGGPPPRSPNAPPQEKQVHDKRDKNAFKPYPGWHSGFRFLGGMMGAAGGVVSGMTQQVTPAVGGLLTTVGGAISPIAWGLGSLAGIPMMAAGGLMTAATVAAQPALQHFGQFADTYRLLGHDRTERMLSEGKGAFTPDEVLRYGGMLHRAGATEGFGTMAQMRFGEIPPDQLAQFFTAATATGAAGRMERKNYDYLAKVLVRGIGADKGKVSMEQSIQTMTSLMQASTEHLGNLDEEQTKQLAGITTAMERKGGPAILRGPLGVQTMVGMMGITAAEGGTAEEMTKWQAFRKRNPGGSYIQYQNWKAGAGATIDIMEDLEGMGEMGVLAGARMYGKNYPAMQKIMQGFREGKSSREATVKALEKEEGKEAPSFAADVKKMEDVYTKTMAEQTADRLKFSKEIMEPYLKMETDLIKGVTEVLKAAHFQKAVTEFGGFIHTLVEKLGGGGGDTTTKKGPITVTRMTWPEFLESLTGFLKSNQGGQTEGSYSKRG